MDKKLAKENIGTSRTLLSNLKQGRFGNARKDIHKLEKNLNYIKKEISTGKAQHEHKEHKTHHKITRSNTMIHRIKIPRL